MKDCPDCRRVFPRGDLAGTGYCRECHNRRGRESRARNGGNRRYRLRGRYGIDLEDVAAMFAAQQGLCASCGLQEARDVDHDHGTGRVRGLLCPPCNTGLGKLGDSAENVRRAVAYLASAAVALEPGTGTG